MNLSDFRARFPEFGPGGDTYVQGYLTSALTYLDAAAWDAVALRSEGQAYLAAHMMAITPAGQTAGLSNKRDGTSPYGRYYDKLCRLVAGGPAVI